MPFSILIFRNWYNSVVMRFWIALLALLAAAGCVDVGTTYNQQATAVPAVVPSPPATTPSWPLESTATLAPVSGSANAASAKELVPSPTAAPSPPQVSLPPSFRAEPLEKMHVERAFPNLSFERMVGMAYPNDNGNRLFVVLQPGIIVSFDNDRNVESADVFLDIRERVSDRGNEEGLLGLAFDPDFRANSHLYVYYSAANPRRSVLSRFTIHDGGSVADPSSERIILEVEQPFSNHNGGQIAFGPDGYLYIGLGDGGSRGDPQGNGQNLSTLLGSIIRIDVSAPDEGASYSIPPDNPFIDRADARGEIWAYGIRNPWRFSFDRVSGELWMADVGQNRLEEVNIVRRGLNYGWNTLEGSECFEPRRDCDSRGLEMPIAEYGRADGCSVTGGYVYRGHRLPSLFGAYVYGDYCSGKIWALRRDGKQIAEHLELVDGNLRISSFGEDPSGEMFILSFDGGIYRLASVAQDFSKSS